jgi:hypothetical protein
VCHDYSAGFQGNDSLDYLTRVNGGAGYASREHLLDGNDSISAIQENTVDSFNVMIFSKQGLHDVVGLPGVIQFPSFGFFSHHSRESPRDQVAPEFDLVHCLSSFLVQTERAALPADRAALLLESGNLLRKVPVV